MIDWSTCPAVERDPERVSGAWVFRGTRVPVAALFENLEDGALVSQFVEWFPGVTIEQVRAVLEHAARSALTPVWVRVLFDQGTPVPLRRMLTQHEVATAHERGWSRLKNGELLDTAEREGFAVLVTTDTNLKCQQNLGARRLAIVVLTTTIWPRIEHVVGAVVAAVDGATAGRRAHQDFWEISYEEWHKTFAVNLHSAFYLAKALVPSMIKRGKGGSIVALGGKYM